ncbi:LysR substrate-binding domain-containing protein [Novosphingobium sp. SG720]|uniref:LysR substrate-binding domain-containing protein n=1 Tax=Novosphingobium sp. SG720 TaxID=2586998 RepID=UPI001446274E|nr:LysR substrate-binding domain-containing protein [Novosphingobium sp. SG720]NKJ41929.1 DNA-binding transcriptional LysR family regulator [Novosphingobium sp. SG720]
MRFKGLDLNLLVCLDALLDLRNVTRAAEHLSLSQPAISAALARLRTFFADPLLVQNGKRMMPTPFALRLQPAIRAILEDVDGLVGSSPHFDPGSSTRDFRICLSDYLASVLLAPLLRHMAQVAPGVRIDMVPLSDDATQRLDRGEIDLLLTPESYVSDEHPSELLFEEEHVVVGWHGNPAMAGPIDVPTFAAAGHVAVEIGRFNRVSFAESYMRAQGIERRVEVRVAAFTIIPELLEGTHRLAVMHRRLAEKAARHFPVTVAPLPFPIPPMREMVQFHRARAEDAGLRWMIDAFHAVARSERDGPGKALV